MSLGIWEFSYLNEECKPGDDEENDGNTVGDERGGDVEVVAARLPVVALVHADLKNERAG